MVQIYLYAKRSNYNHFENYRDTSELLKGIASVTPGIRPLSSTPSANAPSEVTHHFHTPGLWHREKCSASLAEFVSH
ncbi:MAG: hypothetical protein DMG57_37600 [Acidobacteria bacterium]|nr:MAG: hypothetical protein DMG57_37600 [Acidobacteriota bacterium]